MSVEHVGWAGLGLNILQITTGSISLQISAELQCCLLRGETVTAVATISLVWPHILYSIILYSRTVLCIVWGTKEQFLLEDNFAFAVSGRFHARSQFNIDQCTAARLRAILTRKTS